MYNTQQNTTYIKHIVIAACMAFSILAHALETPECMRNTAPGSYGLGFVQGVWAEVALMAVNDACREGMEKLDEQTYLPVLNSNEHKMICSITAFMSGFLLSNVSYHIWNQYVSPIWKYIIQQLRAKSLLRGFTHGRGVSAIAITNTMYTLNRNYSNSDIWYMYCYEIGSLTHTAYVMSRL